MEQDGMEDGMETFCVLGGYVMDARSTALPTLLLDIRAQPACEQCGKDIISSTRCLADHRYRLREIYLGRL